MSKGTWYLIIYYNIYILYKERINEEENWCEIEIKNERGEIIPGATT